MRRFITTLMLATALLTAGVSASASTSMPAKPSLPLSASGCIVLRPGSVNGGVCINVIGTGAYVDHVDAGNWIPTCCDVKGYYVVKTMFPAAGSFSYQLGTASHPFTCFAKFTPYKCWPARIYIRKTLGLYPYVPEGIGGYVKAQQICVYFYSGGKRYGPACELVL